jgi:GNAT superfamily N-acetyltransferase
MPSENNRYDKEYPMPTTMEDVTIRRSTLSADEIYQYFSDADNIMRMHRHKAESSNAGTVEAVIGDDLVGVLFYMKLPHNRTQIKAKVERLFVDPEHRRCGIGRRLVAELAGEFARLEAEVHIQHKAVQRFNESIGFEREGAWGQRIMHPAGVTGDSILLTYSFEGTPDEILG